MKKTFQTEGFVTPSQVEKLRLEAEGFMASSRLPREEAAGVVRLVARVGRLVLERAKASSLVLEMEELADRLELRFVDDGVAFDLAEHLRQESVALSGGDGLARVAGLASDLAWERQGRNNRLLVTIPLEGQAQAGMRLSIETQEGGDGRPWRVTPAGRLDVFSFLNLNQAMEAISARAPKARIILDLSKVTHVASSGWSTLLSRRRLAHSGGGELVVCSLNPDIRRVYDVMKISALLPLAEDAEAAARLLEQAKP